MAEGLSWKDIELHVDNLIPGVLLCGEFLAIGIPLPQGLPNQSEFVNSAVFFSASYALGLVSALISRNILDLVSEYGLRALVFQLFVHGNRTDLLEHYKERDTKFSTDLAHEIIRHKNRIAEWNVIYRSALRLVPEGKRPEVERRRAQGRLTRNLFLPMVIGAGILAHESGSPCWLVFLTMLFVVAVATYLYSYAELNSMAEAHDITAV